jgi:hypothetical protein
LRLDIHLSASHIDLSSIDRMETLGFVEDHFQNCRNCQPSYYHATYVGEISLNDKAVWQDAVSILKSSSEFSGILEFERRVFDHSTPTSTSGPLLRKAEQLPIQRCPLGQYKACDVHIRAMLDDASEAALSWLEGLKIASFEREREGSRSRVYTATFDSLAAGKIFYRIAREQLSLIGSRGVSWKLEQIVSFFREPSDAIALPITYSEQLEDWVRKVSG